jgi:hypothetical protein
MEIQKTDRGFRIVEFTDRNGHKCSLQESSAATQASIWLGPDDAEPCVLVEGKGWQPVEFPADTQFTTRMHLNKQQVRELLPYLQHFALHGDLAVNSCTSNGATT